MNEILIKKYGFMLFKTKESGSLVQQQGEDYIINDLPIRCKLNKQKHEIIQLKTKCRLEKLSISDFASFGKTESKLNSFSNPMSETSLKFSKSIENLDENTLKPHSENNFNCEMNNHSSGSGHKINLIDQALTKFTQKKNSKSKLSILTASSFIQNTKITNFEIIDQMVIEESMDRNSEPLKLTRLSRNSMLDRNSDPQNIHKKSSLSNNNEILLNQQSKVSKLSQHSQFIIDTLGGQFSFSTGKRLEIFKEMERKNKNVIIRLKLEFKKKRILTVERYK